MNTQTELSDIWDKLGNLEGAIFQLEDLEKLLIIFEEGYFDKSNVDLKNSEDMYTLWREYKLKQSLLYTIQRCLSSCTDLFKNNVYQIFDSVKALKIHNSDTNNNLITLTQKVA